MKKFPIVEISPLLEKEDNFVLLESARCDQENRRSYLFLRPRKIIAASRVAQADKCLTELDNVLREGCYTAGFFAYEAGEAFEEKLRSKQNYGFPLLWFGVYKEPLIFDHVKGSFRKRNSTSADPKSPLIPLLQRGDRGDLQVKKNYVLEDIKPNISPAVYARKIARIKELIAQGFTYQVNYTFKLKFAFSGSPLGLYLDLREKQDVAYSALIKMGSVYVLSFSPELFFRKNGAAIITRPMKGTAARGRNVQEDARIAVELQNCPKNKSENLMIVDLLRNDLGRIASCGSVRVSRLFNVERYPTLLQMTSDITGALDRKDMAFEIFRHIFPSGSVTGAPKIKTMEIIRQLEKERRNIYTGSIGFFSPDKSGVFNVAIRTVLIDTLAREGEMGVGSGIVYDSSAPAEYAECCLKANFLTGQTQRFQLIETMLWQKGGFLFLREHLKRLQDSARYFDFVFDRRRCYEALKNIEKRLHKETVNCAVIARTPGIPEGDEAISCPLMRLPRRFAPRNDVSQGCYKVRLLLSKQGEITLESSVLPPMPNKRLKITFSAQKVYSGDAFLYHKTTNRKLYDAQYRKAQSRGFYDVIFTNEKGEITEGAISNIFIKRNGILSTPPVYCGLLDGVYRRHLLRSGKYPVEEKALFKKDIINAEEIYLTNSVRGMVRVFLFVIAGEAKQSSPVVIARSAQRERRSNLPPSLRGVLRLRSGRRSNLY